MITVLCDSCRGTVKGPIGQFELKISISDHNFQVPLKMVCFDLCEACTKAQLRDVITRCLNNKENNATNSSS